MCEMGLDACARSPRIKSRYLATLYAQLADLPLLAQLGRRSDSRQEAGRAVEQAIPARCTAQRQGVWIARKAEQGPGEG